MSERTAGGPPDAPAVGGGHVSMERRRRVGVLAAGGVYLVTEEALSDGRRSEDVALAALAAGVRVIQVREKEGPLRRALEVARALREPTRRAGALLIVNDRVDVALACGADGVHVGQDDLPLDVARSLMGDDALIGLSITEARQLLDPDAAAADYLGVGAVFPTGSKSDATLTGLDLLRAARAWAGARAAGPRAGDPASGLAAGAAGPLPIVAIGGIDAANVERAIHAGADVAAVISAITRAPDPGAAAATLLRAVAAARADVGADGRAEAPADAPADARGGAHGHAASPAPRGGAR